MSRILEQKQRVLDRLRQSHFVHSKDVIDAFMKVPREEFVPPKLRDEAYIDTPLPIGYNQTISAIHMCLWMLELLELKPGLKVLEVGTGSGYHAALLSEVISPAKEKPSKPPRVSLYTVERIKKLADSARMNLEKTGFEGRVKVIHGDGSLGYPPKAPYDRILVTAAAPQVPESLKDQLSANGILVIPVGRSGFWQQLLKIKKTDQGYTTAEHGGVAFVPLIGEKAFRDD